MTDNIGKLILRVMLGSLMLFHGVDKLQHGIGLLKGWLLHRVYLNFSVWCVRRRDSLLLYF